MKKEFKIYYTSDTHGYINPVNYITKTINNAGLIACGEQFEKDGNTLIIDGGDTIQGSPFTMHTAKKNYTEHPVATVLNVAKYDFITLGNHDFNYGEEHLNNYLSTVKADCLCANVYDSSATLPIGNFAIKTLENGLKIGIVGIVTDFVNVWEKPENIKNLTISDPFVAAKEALTELKSQVDVTICLYHGGFENDLENGELLSKTTENIGYKIAKELDFDLLLTAHQHMPVEGLEIHGTYIVQPAANAERFLEINATVDNGSINFKSSFQTPGTGDSFSNYSELRKLEAEVQTWLDEPVGFLDQPLLPDTKAKMALNGTLIADFFNQIQLEITGADISCTSLANEIKGFDAEVTVRDVVATYIYPNTLCTLEVSGVALKTALETVASYLEIGADSEPEVSQKFLHPKVEHFNFDYFAGLTYEADLRQPVGKRISNVLVNGNLINDTETYTVAMNNYRKTGVGGYEVYAECPLLKEEPVEISELIIGYLEKYKNVVVREFEKSKFIW